MDRGQIVVGAIVAAAIALFGLKIWSDRTSSEDALLSGGRNPQLASRDGSGSESGDSAFGTSGTEPGSRTGARYRHFAGPEGGRPGSAGSGTRGRAGARAAEALRGAARRGGGFVGSSGSRAGSHLAGGSSASGAGEPASNHLGPHPKQHDELVDFLGSQPPTRNQVLGGDTPANPGEDVVLEVNSVQDSQQAIDAKNVNEAQDGVGLDLSSDSVLAFPNAGNANGDAGSISFDIDPQWTGSDQTDNSLVQIRTPNGWDNRMQLVKNGRYLRFILTDNTGRESDISVPIDQWTHGPAAYGDQHLGRRKNHLVHRRAAGRPEQVHRLVPDPAQHPDVRRVGPTWRQLCGGQRNDSELQGLRPRAGAGRGRQQLAGLAREQLQKERPSARSGRRPFSLRGCRRFTSCRPCLPYRPCHPAACRARRPSLQASRRSSPRS